MISHVAAAVQQLCCYVSALLMCCGCVAGLQLFCFAVAVLLCCSCVVIFCCVLLCCYSLPCFCCVAVLLCCCGASRSSGIASPQDGVSTISRLLTIIGLYCRIQSLLQGSFAKETFNLKEPTNHSHPIACSSGLCVRQQALYFRIANYCIFPHIFSKMPVDGHTETQ